MKTNRFVLNYYVLHPSTYEDVSDNFVLALVQYLVASLCKPLSLCSIYLKNMSVSKLTKSFSSLLSIILEQPMLKNSELNNVINFMYM